jgi:DNA-directed RNA polymerase specialized sigma24 family protein
VSFDAEGWFRDNQRFLDALLATIARRQRLRDDAAEDFAAWAKVRLWENEYALLRKWRGDSKLTTYLTTVAVNLGREYRVQHWGRWRPSAAAQRLGRVAILLEQLVYRDAMSLREAAEWLRTEKLTDLSDRALAAVLDKLPRRKPSPRTAGGDEPVERVIGDARADEPIDEEEGDEAWWALRRALQGAIARLAPLDQVVIHMHFIQGYTLADVARALKNVDQRSLYRLKDSALFALRRALTEAGIRWEEVRDLLDAARTPDDLPGGETDASRPSNESYARDRRSDP